MAVQTCAKCVLDTGDDPDITFDPQGTCNYCHNYTTAARQQIFEGAKGELLLAEKIDEIKKAGKDQAYDCILGVSGGVDSTYVAWLAKKHGLRPLLVHFDNGWNSELAVINIENIVSKLNFDLYTYVINWQEFRDLQLSFLKASVVDIEITTDHAIFAALYHLARKNKIRYIISGLNIATEAVMPLHWVHKKNDWLNIKDIHSKFGSVKLKTFPRTSYFTGLLNTFMFKVDGFPILNYVPYNYAEVKDFIIRELGWRDYGGKHYESIFTRFYQAYILPVKFGIDKRKAHYSNLICSGQLTREAALELLKKPTYDEKLLIEDKEYVIKKFQISPDEFDQIMAAPVKKHLDYRSYINEHWKYNDFFFKTVRMLLSPFRKR